MKKDDLAVKRYSLAKQCADKLEAMIESGEYEVGSKIHTETELMQIFDVSRNTLREAIQTLASIGMLEVRQGDGTYVRSNNRFNANMKKEFAKASSEDVYEVRNALEITIARIAAMRRTEDDIDELRKTLMNRQCLRLSIKENTQADVAFHVAIAQSAHNKLMYDLYVSIVGFMETDISNKMRTSTVSQSKIDELHETLFKAILDQDPDTAVEAVHNILSI